MKSKYVSEKFGLELKLVNCQLLENITFNLKFFLSLTRPTGRFYLIIIQHHSVSFSIRERERQQRDNRKTTERERERERESHNSGLKTDTQIQKQLSDILPKIVSIPN